MCEFERKLPKLGFGLMRLPQEGDGLDLSRLCHMVDAYMESGMNYFDTAYMYCDGKSESAAKTALVDRYPRESFYLTDKLPQWMMHGIEDRDRIFNDQLARTGAGYFDIYLLHSVEDGSNYEGYVKYDCFNWAMQKKRKEKSDISVFRITERRNCWMRYCQSIRRWKLSRYSSITPTGTVRLYSPVNYMMYSESMRNRSWLWNR